MPNYLGHPDNYIQANPLSTPAHIVPEWYFLPFYAILRAIPNKLFGVAGLIGAIVISGLATTFLLLAGARLSANAEVVAAWFSIVTWT